MRRAEWIDARGTWDRKGGADGWDSAERMSWFVSVMTWPGDEGCGCGCGWGRGILCCHWRMWFHFARASDSESDDHVEASFVRAGCVCVGDEDEAGVEPASMSVLLAGR